MSIGTFREWLREGELNEGISSAVYKKALELENMDSELEDLLYKYGDSNVEMNRASNEKAYIVLFKKFKDLNTKFSSKYGNYSDILTAYQKQEALKKSNIKPKTKEGKLFLRALDFKEKYNIMPIQPDGDYAEGWQLILNAKEYETLKETGVMKSNYGNFADKINALTDIAKKELVKIISEYLKMLGKHIGGSSSFRKHISNNNNDSYDEINVIINKKIPILFTGFYQNVNNW